MFFGLRRVPSHPLYQLHPAMLCFFQHCLTAAGFNVNCFPAWIRPVIRRSPKLRGYLEAIARLLQEQRQDIRELIFDAFQNNNKIRDLCEDTSRPLITLEVVPEDLLRQIRELFEHLYNRTINTDVFCRAINGASIDDHYLQFRSINKSVCPFCGIEDYPDPTSGTRASYDHYLTRSNYPLAGVNFENLIPMCKSCNEPPNKGANDILFTSRERTIRRQVFYPFRRQRGASLKVTCRVKPSLTNPTGKWEVDLTPINSGDASKAQTWDHVFRIKGRLQARVEDKNEVWTRHFIASHFSNSQCSVPSLRRALGDESRTLSDPYYLRARRETLLQKAFYEYLSKHAEEVVIESYCMMARTPYIDATAQRGRSLIQ